jgi:hypothetical protein
MGKQHTSLPKAAGDNRANQLNPNNPAYWSSRGVTPPASPGAVPATGSPLPAEHSAGDAGRNSGQQDK